MWRFLLCFGQLALLQLAWAADPSPLVTIVEGQGQLIRGAAKFSLLEGMTLQADDIVETGSAGLVQLEFADGVKVAMGPASRVLFLAAPLSDLAGPRPGRLYLLRGWTKWSAPGAQPTPGFTSSRLDIRSFSGAVAASTDEKESRVFSEAGEALLAERRSKARPTIIGLKAGEYYSRVGDDKASVTGRPSPAFLQEMPRAFLDSLPSRIDRFRDRKPQPMKPTGEVSFADIEPWLAADPNVRQLILERSGAASDRVGLSALLADNSAMTRELQLQLRGEGHDPGPIDGIYGPRTEAALRTFQLAQGDKTLRAAVLRAFRSQAEWIRALLPEGASRDVQPSVGR
jgi:hypothetical protein